MALIAVVFDAFARPFRTRGFAPDARIRTDRAKDAARGPQTADASKKSAIVQVGAPGAA